MQLDSRRDRVRATRAIVRHRQHLGTISPAIKGVAEYTSQQIPYPFMIMVVARDLSVRPIREYPQSPPKFWKNQHWARLSLVVATRGGYKPFGC